MAGRCAHHHCHNHLVLVSSELTGGSPLPLHDNSSSSSMLLHCESDQLTLSNLQLSLDQSGAAKQGMTTACCPPYIAQQLISRGWCACYIHSVSSLPTDGGAQSIAYACMATTSGKDSLTNNSYALQVVSTTHPYTALTSAPLPFGERDPCTYSAPGHLQLCRLLTVLVL